MADINEIKSEVISILQQVGDLLRTNPEINKISTKTGRTDLVTNWDKQIEKKVDEDLRKKFPEAHIISEEGFGDHSINLDGLVFFVDPIDGTMNFVKCRDDFASMIGVYQDGKPIFGGIMDIMNNNIYYGGPKIGSFVNTTKLNDPEDLDLCDSLVTISNRLLFTNHYDVWQVAKSSCGLRIYGSAGIIFSRIFDGKENVYISHLKPWDLAAGRAIGAGLGIEVSTVDGKPINMLKSQTVIIGTRCASKEARDIISNAE